MIVQLDGRSGRVVAHSVLDRKRFPDAEIILRVSAETPVAKIHIRQAELFAGAVGQADQKVGEVIAGARRRDFRWRSSSLVSKPVKANWPRGLGLVLVFNSISAKFPAKAHGVFGMRPGESLGEPRGLIARERRNRIVQAGKIREADLRNAEVDGRRGNAR